MMIAGIGGGTRNGTVALAEGGRLVGACSQERVTRVRGAGINATGLPDEAFDLLLAAAGRTRADVGHIVSVDGDRPRPAGLDDERIDHHYAHACTAYFTSPFADATVVVCDHEAPNVSVWMGTGPDLRRVEWPWSGPGFAQVFSRLAAALGFAGAAADQRVEALARLRPDSRDAEVDRGLRLDAGTLVVDPSLDRFIDERLSRDADGAGQARARLAASLQARLGHLLLELLGEVRRRLGGARLCLGGSFFYHSSMNTRARRAGLFDEVFVPVDPGDGGLSVGAALHALGAAPAQASPFLGPSYSAEDTKQILDNCKLQYSLESEEGAIMAAVRALRDGHLVAWFDGGMEWGPRALGARCILANPFSPYVLENLNHFLKRREPWRGYALSGLRDAVGEHFDGPDRAPFMECDYRPRDVARFREALPSAEAAVRVHTVDDHHDLPRFHRLLEAFGETAGLPFVINTSFNGFHEPIVCNPRDAVRVFYGTGLDLLVLNQFVIRK